MIKKVVNSKGKVVFVGSEETARELIGDRDGYTIAEGTEADRAKYVATINTVLTKTLLAHSVVHGGFTTDAALNVMGKTPSRWKNYISAIDGKASNRGWDDVLWAVVKPIKAKIVAKLKAAAA